MYLALPLSLKMGFSTTYGFEVGVDLISSQIGKIVGKISKI